MLSKVTFPSSTNFLASSFPVYARTYKEQENKIPKEVYTPSEKEMQETQEMQRKDYRWSITDTKIFWDWLSNIFIIHFHIHKDELQAMKKGINEMPNEIWILFQNKVSSNSNSKQSQKKECKVICNAS